MDEKVSTSSQSMCNVTYVDVLNIWHYSVKAHMIEGLVRSAIYIRMTGTQIRPQPFGLSIR